MSDSTAIWLLIVSPLVAAAVHALLAFRRQREPLLLLPPAVLAALAWRHVIAPPALPLAAETGEAAAAPLAPLLVAFAINVVAAATSVLVVRLAHERGRAEQVHWEGLEALRKLVDALAGRDPSRRGDAAAGALVELLELGCERFAADTALCVRVANANGERQWTRLAHFAARAPSDEAPALDRALDRAGSAAYEQTPVSRLLAADGPLALDRLANARWSDGAIPSALHCDSFIGCTTALAGGDRIVLAFFVREARERRFTAFDKSLVQLLCAWLAERHAAADARAAGAAPPREAPEPRIASGESAPEQSARALQASANELEAAVTEAEQSARRAAEIATGAPPQSTGAEPPRRRGLQEPTALDETLERLANRIAPVPGPQGEPPIDWKLAARPLRAALPARTIEQLLRSLVAHAKTAGGAPSSILIKSSPVASPDGDEAAFVLLEVEAQGVRLSPDELAALHAGRTPAPSTAHRVVALRRIMTLLRNIGGDLSIETNDAGEAPLLRFIAYLPTPAAADSADRDGIAAESAHATPSGP